MDDPDLFADSHDVDPLAVNIIASIKYSPIVYVSGRRQLQRAIEYFYEGALAASGWPHDGRDSFFWEMAINVM